MRARNGGFSLRWCEPAAALLGLMLWGALAAAVDFTGPASQQQIGASLCGVRVRWAGLDRDYFAAGTRLGALSLNSYEPASRSFIVQQRLFPGGAVVAIEPWRDRPGSQPGLVVATVNPDRILFVDLQPVFPFLTVVAEVPLSEDPGQLAWVGGTAAGQAELAVSLPGVDLVAVLARTAAGWAAVAEVPTGDNPSCVVGVDLDGDGVRELVMAQTGALSGTLGVLWWRADGSRALETMALPGVSPGLVAAGDLDGDGLAELAVARADTAQVVFYKWGGGPPAEYGRANLTVLAGAMFVANLSDGNPGLCVASSGRGMVEVLGGSGLQWNRWGTYYPGCRPRAITLADVDGDGLDDMISFGGEGEVITVMLGDGVPGFAGFSAVGLRGVPGAFVEADVDGDGAVDLVATTVNEPVLSIFRGDGSGLLATTPEVLTLGFVPGAVAAAGLDGDAAAEIVALDFAGGAVVVLDYSVQTGLSERSRTTVGAFPFDVEPGDVDGDGHLDLVVLTQSLPEVKVLFGQGDGSLPSQVALGFGTPADRVLPLDLDADGLLDLVATDGQNRVWMALNSGGRTFPGQSFVVAGTGALDMGRGDLDGDGDDDLVVANRSAQTLTVFENTGLGGLAVRTDAVPVPGTPQGLVLADFDRDGQLDVLLNLPIDGELDLLFGTGNWNFSFPLAIAAGPAVAGIGVTDANGDGFPDIFVADQSLQLGLVLLNRDAPQVAVDPAAVVASCVAGGIELRVRPDRPGPWTLELGEPGRWRLVMTNGQAGVGAVEFEGGEWRLRLVAAQVAVWESAPMWARLTVGTGVLIESRIWPVAGGCAAAAAGLRPLAWRTAPWPNPFNPVVEAAYTLRHPGRVRVQVVDLSGRRVALLWDGTNSAGEHEVRWDGRGPAGPAAAGVYFLQVAADRGVISRKIVLVK